MCLTALSVDESYEFFLAVWNSARRFAKDENVVAGDAAVVRPPPVTVFSMIVGVLPLPSPSSRSI